MIKVKDIKKAFSENRVLNGVSFSVGRGEIYGLIGKNGAGKTTLMNIMSGLSSADSGSYSYEDVKDDNSKVRLKIGYLPDLPAFFDYLSVGEYLDYLLMNNNARKKDELLELVDLNGKVRIATMSRGMRQRLGIAAAMVHDPEVILLDEPTSALDPSGRADVMRVLMELKKQGRSIVLSTHILADMERVCDRVGFLSKGVIKQELRIKDLDRASDYIRVTFGGKEVDAGIFNRAGVEYELIEDNVYRFSISDNYVNSQKAIWTALLNVDLPITSIHNEPVNLEKVFQEICR
ncbi:MAG: ABC transporter ATP-binding protein [Lachnospiraceae bacterium]|nr:ABC transporter ATP-binding protein [Lachnospiraceae bacterium]